MSVRIRKAAVLGAGVMGRGIAAHLANAGIPVLLLDVVPPKAGAGEDPASRAFRDRLARAAIANLRRQKPAPLFSDAALGLVETGNLDDDLNRIGGYDWVVEAVKEDVDVKRSLFARVEPHLRPDAVISSNTSGLSIEAMLEGRPATFLRRFLVTHFFNPVRYMKLLELVPGRDTDPEVLEAMHRFGEETLGKGVVHGKDTTNFIANRIGVYAMLRTLGLMREAGLSVEEVDRIFGPAMGRPKSAVFRTADVVGLDTLVHVARNCFDSLVDDEAREVFRVPDFVERMVERGLLGEKAKAGFYRKVPGPEGGSEILILDPDTLAYRQQKKVRFPSLGAAREIEDVRARIRTVLEGSDPAAAFAGRVTLDVLAYASRRIPEIADDLVDVDRAMRWGFGWELGPFETWDVFGVRRGVERMRALGIEPAGWVEEMLASGRESFYGVEAGRDTFWSIGARRAEPVAQNPRRLAVEHLRRAGDRIEGNDSASLRDMGDGILLLEFHSKMNSIDDGIIDLMHRAVDRAERDFRGLVIGNDGANFSAGANLMAILMAIGSGEWEALRRMVRGFQQANQRMRYSSVPVVAAPFGMALGGGAEVVLGANAVQAAAESYVGLVEVGVGVIPGGGGTMMLLRNLFGPWAGDPGIDPLPFVARAFQTIGMAKVATSAEEARALGFLSAQDGITLNRDFLLSDAKARAIGLAASGFRPPRPATFRLPGPSGRATIDMMLYDLEVNGKITAHDRKIGRTLARVLTGGETAPGVPVSEERLLELELEGFLSLCGEEKSRERMMAMLQTGKPLRN